MKPEEYKYGQEFYWNESLLLDDMIERKVEEEAKPTFNAGDKDLCKTCCNCWQDLVIWPVKQYVSHCAILDKKEGFIKMDDVVPYPCIECPFNSYNRKN